MVDLTLNFDAMDARLAEEYLKENDSGIKLLKSSIEDVKEILPNKISMKHKFMILAQKMEQNAELFSQLEFLIRKIPKPEVKQSDIPLLVQNFLYWSSNTNFKYPSGLDLISVGKSSPLATLGLVAPQFLWEHSVVIHAVPTTVAVCYLFSQLCVQAGFHKVLIELCEEDLRGDIVQGQDANVAYCAGVITQRSDLDSAVDAFLASTTRVSMYPWTLRRVWVQESIYQQFRNVLAWKCKLTSSTVTVEPHIKSLCSEVFGYDQKMFLVDYAGNPVDVSEGTCLPIMVEAYRTTKELFSLLTQHRPWAVSLWSGDLSEANEIAFGVESRLVWVNEYGTFTGPPKASQVYYSNIYRGFESFEGELEKVLKLHNTWCKLSVADRIRRLRNSLGKLVTTSLDAEQLRNLIDKLDEGVSDTKFDKLDKFVEIAKGKICIGTSEPTGVVWVKNYASDIESLYDLFISMIHGNAIVFTYVKKLAAADVLGNLFRVFEEDQLPIAAISDVLPSSLVKTSVSGYLYRTKVVWMNYGTTFAN